MEKHKESILTLTTFLVMVVAFYFVGYWLIYRMGQATPLMLSVGAATLVTCYLRKRSVAELGWQWCNWYDVRINYVLPFAIALVSYLLIWLLGFGDFYNAEFIASRKDAYNLANWNDLSVFIFHFGLVGIISFIVSLPSILGEELGWRGFLVPELAKLMSFKGVAITSGFVWALFHWPLIILGLYGNDVTPLLYQLGVFSLFITATGVVLAYFRLKTQSVWPAVVYHASSNIFIQKVFTPVTIATDNSPWYIDEFGVVMAVVASCAAVYFLRKGSAEFDVSLNQSAESSYGK